jgi:hypothetical protein
MSGKPIILPARHAVNLELFALTAYLIYLFCLSGGSAWLFWAITLCALAFGALIIVPIGGADMPVVISMLNSYSGWAAAGIGFTLGDGALIVPGAVVAPRRHPLLHHVQGHEPLVRVGDPGQLRRRDIRPGAGRGRETGSARTPRS